MKEILHAYLEMKREENIVIGFTGGKKVASDASVPKSYVPSSQGCKAAVWDLSVFIEIPYGPFGTLG